MPNIASATRTKITYAILLIGGILITFQIGRIVGTIITSLVNGNIC